MRGYTQAEEDRSGVNRGARKLWNVRRKFRRFTVHCQDINLSFSSR